MNALHASQSIRETYTPLSRQKDLSPSNQVVNDTLSRLVSCLCDWFASGHNLELAKDATLEEERLGLPKLCGQAECEMEEYWARYFVAKPDLSATDLKEFWYYKNYEMLWNLEWNLIGLVKAEKIVFLGSGPLPLTAIIAVMQDPTLEIECVDFNETACALSMDLIAKLGLSRNITVVRSAATDYAFAPGQLIICASLITEKSKLYDVMWKKGITDFAVRDAEGCYCFLYQPSPLPQAERYRELRCTIPNRFCINTTRYFTRLS